MPMRKLRIDFKKNAKQIMIFMALVAMLALVSYFNFILRPQVSWAVGAIRNMSKMAGDLKRSKDTIARIPKFKSDISAYKGQVDSYERMLPAEQEIPTFLENLSGMAKSSGVKIEGVAPVTKKEEKAQTGQVYQEMPILITAKSGYHELGQFLCRLENAERFIKVVDITIRSNKLTPKRHDVELLVLTYILTKGR